MKKLDNILMTILSIYVMIVIVVLFWQYVYFKFIKDNDIKQEIKIVDKVNENYIPYKNNTINNFQNLLIDINSKIKDTKWQIIEADKSIIQNDRLKLDNFDFYSKYQMQISFFEYLFDNKVYLRDFEKRQILLYDWTLPEKVLKSIEKNIEFDYKINSELLGENKKIVYNKNTQTIRVQKYDEKEEKWINIYFWKLEFNNIINEYVYDIKFINKKDNDWIYWIVYSVANNWDLRNHYITIDIQNKNITNIRNNYMSNIFYKNMTENNCNKRYRYLYINTEKDKATIYCRDSVTWLLKNFDILVSN